MSIAAKVYAYIGAAWVELDEVAPGRVTRGLSDNNPETRLADIGEFTTTLNNNSGAYTPGNTAGWKRGIPLKLVITYDGTDYIKFRGVIDNIELESNPDDKTVSITALDWLDFASKYPIVNPDLLENVTADMAVTSIVSAVPVQPQAQTLDTGDIIYPTVFDTVRENTKAYAELAKIVNSETGFAYIRTDQPSGENLIFEALDYRNGTRVNSTVPVLLASADTRITRGGNTRITRGGNTRFARKNQAATYNDGFLSVDVEYGQRIINRFTANSYPKRTDTVPVKIYTSERPVYLAAGQTKTFRIFWSDPTGKRVINARPPNAISNIKALCHFDTQNGDYFPDETGKSWYANDAPLVTNVVKYGYGSAYLDGTDSYLYSPDSPDWDFGSGDFTVEWFEYRFNNTAGATAISRIGAGYSPFTLGYSDTTILGIYMSSNGLSNDIANNKSLGAITLNTWNHFAVSRAAGNFYAFKNGTLTDSWSSGGTLPDASTPLYIGKYTTTYLTACIDDVRITKGEALYTSSFAAPSAPLTIYGAFFSIWTSENGTGTDISSNLVSSADYGTEGAVLTVQNTAAVPGYLNINIYGYGIYSDSSLQDTQEDTPSINSFGYQNETLQQAYMQDNSLGKLEGARVVEQYRQPATILNSVTMNANKSSFNMMSFLNLDVGDLVRLKVTKHGIEGMYYIQGMTYTINNGVIVYKWIVKEAETLALGYSPLVVEFAGGAATDVINYGYLPIVSADTVTHRVISAWVYLDAIIATQGQYIFNIGGQYSGVTLGMEADATYRILQFSATGFSTTAGKWETSGAGNCFALGAWNHVFVEYDRSLTTNDPILYIEGVLTALTETATPAGTVTSEKGQSLTIGNEYNLSVNCFNGKIKDVRVYDMAKTTQTSAALAAALHTEGAYGTGYLEGMVFNAFIIRTENLTAYTDLTLTTEKVLEAYNGYVGSPSGSPITRIP